MQKNVLLIGGTGGIGSAIVEKFLRNHMRVLATYYKDSKKAEDMLSRLSRTNLEFFQLSLEDPQSIEKIVQVIKEKYKVIDVVVFSATLSTSNKQVLDMDWQDFQRHLEIQTKGMFYIAKNLSSQIKQKYKTKFVVILTEYCSGRPPKGLSDYISAKYSLMGLAKCMAAEFARYNCTVNMISPGMTETGLIAGLPAKLIEITAENNPLKRIARPEDIAGVALFLASDDSDYINGVNILVNGGNIML